MDEKFYTKFTEKKVKKTKKDKNLAPKVKEQIAEKRDYKKEYKTEKTAEQKKDVFFNRIDGRITSETNLFVESKISSETKSIIENFDKILQAISPLNSRQLQLLPEDIQDLSHQMTDNRGERRLGYMNESVQLTAYSRYFVWWNLIRLSRLFTNLPAKAFPKDNCFCMDLGSGPLTVVISLWLSRPELRSKKLVWYCLDLSNNSLKLGEDIYLSIAAKTPEFTPWKIIKVKGSFGTHINEKCDFITCANMFNKIDQTNDMPPEFQTKKYFDQLLEYSTEQTKYLLIEPGFPKSARTLSLLRERFINEQKQILSPCTHTENCPMNGFNAYTGSSCKWCNFAFSTENAPSALRNLSTDAHLQKDRAVLSFISVISDSKKQSNKENELTVRITSDPLKLSRNHTGFYACSKIGLLLLEFCSESNHSSGDELTIELKTAIEKLYVDSKTGYKKIILR